MQKAAAEIVKTRLNHDGERDGEYTGPVTEREYKLFRYMADLDSVSKLYAEPTIQGEQWVLWSITFNERKSMLQKIADELAVLIAKYPSKVAIAGAWHIEFGKPFSRQVGTQYLIESVEQFINDPQFNQPNIANPDFEPGVDDREIIPDPTWIAPDPWPQVSVGFADEITGVTGTPTYPIPATALLKFMPDVNGNPATELADVNLGQGWPPRRFT